MKDFGPLSIISFLFCFNTAKASLMSLVQLRSDTWKIKTWITSGAAARVLLAPEYITVLVEWNFCEHSILCMYKYSKY